MHQFVRLVPGIPMLRDWVGVYVYSSSLVSLI